MSLTYFIEKHFQKNSRMVVTKILELQIHWYKLYSKIVNILILEEFLNFLHQIYSKILMIAMDNLTIQI